MSLRRSRRRTLLASAAAVLIVVPGIAFAGAGPGGATAGDEQLITDAKRTERAIVTAWNARKWDELSQLYAEDALLLPPNSEPVQGREAIIRYFRGVRDVVGEIADGWEYLRVKASGTFASLTGKVALQSGRFRMTYNDLYERQSDGSVLITVNGIGFREQPVG